MHNGATLETFNDKIITSRYSGSVKEEHDKIPVHGFKKCFEVLYLQDGAAITGHEVARIVDGPPKTIAWIIRN
jgi:hypothetical protein